MDIDVGILHFGWEELEATQGDDFLFLLRLGLSGKQQKMTISGT